MKKKRKIVKEGKISLWFDSPDSYSPLFLIRKPENVKFVKEHLTDLRDAHLQYFFARTYNSLVVTSEMMGRSYFCEAKRAVKRYERAISELEKIMNPHWGQGVWGPRWIQMIEEDVELLKKNKDMIVYVTSTTMSQEAWKKDPVAKTVRKMFVFQAFILFGFLKDLIRKKYGKDRHYDRMDFLLYRIIAELFQRVYGRSSPQMKKISHLKVKEYVEEVEKTGFDIIVREKLRSISSELSNPPARIPPLIQ